ncbi:MAG TPA: tetratricopeptide repeat protein, partial [Bryobacteraceae bacterium]|nr:tetratricopeptide repeat protein [Bryobacteraceae bacterium]
MQHLKRWCAAHPTRLFLILSACSVLVLYRNAFHSNFVYDDVDHIVNNPVLLSWNSVFGQYFERGVPFGGDYLSGPPESFYRPIFWLSLALDQRLFASAAAFHFTNLLLHWANGCVGFVLLRRLGMPAWRAMAVVVVWLILPINSEAVVWISARPYGLSTFFILIALLFAENYLHSGLIISGAVGYSIANVLALLSNDAGLFVVPLTLLLAFTKQKLLSRYSAVLCAVGGSVDAAYFLLRRMVGAPSPPHASTLIPVGLTMVKYLQWMFLPIHMSVERSSDTPVNLSRLGGIAILCGLGLLVPLTFQLRKCAPEFAAGMAWIAITLLPYSGIVFIYQGMAERYTYLASMGMALALTSLAWRLKTRAVGRRLLLGCFTIWLVWGAWRLNSRVLDWHNDMSLYASSLKADPNSPVLLYNLAATLEDAGDLRTALLLTARALYLKPGYERAVNGLGTMYMRIGSFKQAKVTFERAVALNPGDEQAIYNLGTIYLRLGRPYEASVRFERALALQPRDVR